MNDKSVLIEFWKEQEKSLGTRVTKIPSGTTEHMVGCTFFCKAQEKVRLSEWAKGNDAIGFPFQRAMAKYYYSSI